MDGPPLADKLPALPQHLPQWSYRPHPERRGERPKADGTRRPLGSRGTADQSVQERARRRLDALEAAGGLGDRVRRPTGTEQS